MITHETLEKIHAIFMHLQTAGQTPPQIYNPDEEYRKGILIVKNLKQNGNVTEAYCNSDKFNKWHMKIWEKRKKEIPHHGYIEILPDGTGWRIGFKC